MPISWAMSFPEAGYAFAIPVSTAHWASLTGLTDSRDWRSISMPASFDSAFIAASVTGFASASTGLTATETQRGSSPSCCAVRVISITPTAAFSLPL